MKHATESLGICLLAALASTWVGIEIASAKAPPTQEAEGKVISLNQAWSEGDRQWFYQTTQGSTVLSWDIYSHLENAANQDLFRSDENAIRYGLIPQRANAKYNPDGLPIGVTKTVVTTGRYKGEWVGLTCAACHTSMLYYKGTRIVIDGGGTHTFDSAAMTRDLDAALQATVTDPAKFARLATRVGAAGAADKDALRTRLDSEAAVVHYYSTKSLLSPTVWGPGRIDALSLIHNQLAANLTGMPENWYPATAPVKPPFLWNAPQSAWVQWSGTVQDAIFRNLGESLGVYAWVDLTSKTPETGLFDATSNLLNLWQLERVVERLAPPKWPEDIFGKIDRAKAAKGRDLFAENCSKCHTTWPYKWTEPNKAGKRFIDNAIVSTNYVGTDASQLDNFLPYSITGQFAPYQFPPFTGQALAPSGEFTVSLVFQVVKKALAQLDLSKEDIDDLHGYRPYYPEPTGAPPETHGYKAAPRDGVWATGPFLHNGSVPNLYEMLLPASERSKTFHITREFDPVKVGVDTRATADSFLFDTSRPGNSNAGHSFEDAPKGKGVIGRLLTDDERWAIIEYLKSIPDVEGRVTPFGGPGSTPPNGGKGDYRTGYGAAH
jgi:hypothetical protein